MSRSWIPPYVAANSAISAAEGAGARKRAWIVSRRSSSAIAPSATAELARARARAARYGARLPPKRRSTIARSATRTSPGPTEAARCCTSRA